MNWFDFLTTHLAGPLGYAGVLFLLMVCGLGVPVPEDIILISGGYIAATGGHRAWPMMLIGLVGIVVGDSIIYALGRQLGPPIARRPPLNRVLTPERLVRVEGLFRRYGQVILMAARFMPGVRAVAFFSAGTTKVPYYKFLGFDGSAALISAPLWVFLGFRFSDNITELFERARHAQHWVLGGGLVVIAAIFIGVQLANSRRKPAAEASEESLTPVLPAPARGLEEDQAASNRRVARG